MKKKIDLFLKILDFQDLLSQINLEHISTATVFVYRISRGVRAKRARRKFEPHAKRAARTADQTPRSLWWILNLNVGF